jgi:hypothetical protein
VDESETAERGGFREWWAGDVRVHGGIRVRKRGERAQRGHSLLFGARDDLRLDVGFCEQARARGAAHSGDENEGGAGFFHGMGKRMG